MILKEVQESVLSHADSIFPLDRQGKRPTCPICGNGSGSSGDGLAPDPHHHGKFKCFKCGFYGDLIAFAAQSQNKTYIEMAREFAEMFGIEHHFGEDFIPIQKKTPVITVEPGDVPKKDYTEYLNYVHSLVHKDKTGYFSRRGFGANTINHFNLGFDPTWQHPKLLQEGKAPMSPRAIVPISQFSYLARDVRFPLTDKQKKYAKQKVGSVEIFNPQALNDPFPFIVEGEFDAMSFYEIGVSAVALGSISYSNKLFAYLEESHIMPKRLLIALDNDNSGLNAAKVLVQQLADKGFPVHLCDSSVLYGNHKDANEFLVADRSLFSQTVSKTIEFVKSFSDEVITTDLNIEPIETLSTREGVHISGSASPIVVQTSQTFDADTTTSYPDRVTSALQAAILILQSVSDFSQENIFSDKVLHAAAVCQLDSLNHFLTFRDKCKQNKIGVTVFDSAVKRVMKSVIKFRNQQQLGDLRGMTQDIHNPQALQQDDLRQQTIEKLESLDYSTLADDNDACQNIISLIRDNLLTCNRAGRLEPTVKNIEAILKYDPNVRDCIGRDLFQQKFVAKRDLPWYPAGTKTKGKNWANNDDIGFENYIDRNYNGFRNSKLIFAALNEWAFNHPVHPVQDYLQSLTWDGTPRLDKIFVDTLGYPDTDYTHAVTHHWFMAAIARVFNPGCKWDYCLVLKGTQGIGKSSVLYELGKRTWFNDSICSITGKDAMENLIGSWIVELDEMNALKNANNESIKAFISRQVDKFRLPYERRKEEFPRQCVFAATTNSVTFLKDKTGGRRFLILVSDAEKDTTAERLKILNDDYVNQVWAEAFHKYKEMFADGFDHKKLLPPESILDIAEEFQKFSTEGSELEGMIDAYLRIPIPEKAKWKKMTREARRRFMASNVPVDEEERTVLVDMETGEVVAEGGESVDLVNRDYVSAVEIAYECFNVDNPMRDRQLIKEITEIMARMEGWKQVTWKRCGVYGQQRVAFARC